MLIFAIVMSSIIAYVIGGAWVYGYVAGLDDDYTGFLYDPRPVLSAVFWPVASLLLIATPVLRAVSAHGLHRSKKSKQVRKLRVEIEEKLRIEQLRWEKEAEKEIEETLRHTMKA